MPDVIFRGETNPGSRSISFQIRDIDGALAPGLTEADVTIKTAKPGADFLASAATLVERSGSVDGAVYDLIFTAAEVDTDGDLKFEVSSGTTAIVTVPGYVSIQNPGVISSAVLDAMPADHMIPGSYGEQLARPIGAVIGNAGNSPISFKTNIASPADCKDAWVSFVSGALQDQVHKILLFDAATKVVTLVNPFSGTPVDGDRFVLINR